jgi:hypothetical protein
MLWWISKYCIYYSSLAGNLIGNFGLNAVTGFVFLSMCLFCMQWTQKHIPWGRISLELLFSLNFEPIVYMLLIPSWLMCLLDLDNCQPLSISLVHLMEYLMDCLNLKSLFGFRFSHCSELEALTSATSAQWQKHWLK